MSHPSPTPPHPAAPFTAPIPITPINPNVAPSKEPGSVASSWAAAGKLKAIARVVFERAYGLNRRSREDHEALCLEVMRLTQCSRKSFCELVYGHSYASELGDLRALVPGYKPKEPRKRPGTKMKQNDHTRNVSFLPRGRSCCAELSCFCPASPFVV